MSAERKLRIVKHNDSVVISAFLDLAKEQSATELTVSVIGAGNINSLRQGVNDKSRGTAVLGTRFAGLIALVSLLWRGLWLDLWWLLRNRQRSKPLENEPFYYCNQSGVMRRLLILILFQSRLLGE
jgi:hypothetical protein